MLLVAQTMASELLLLGGGVHEDYFPTFPLNTAPSPSVSPLKHVSSKPRFLYFIPFAAAVVVGRGIFIFLPYQKKKKKLRRPFVGGAVQTGFILPPPLYVTLFLF